jgi:ADP-ribose pyrophosphatase YjhB (NUDIX family)
MAETRMGDRAYRMALEVYRRLPDPVGEWLARLLTPSYAVGTSPFVSRADGRVLLVRHSYKDGWSTPGGFVDRNERAEDGAVREVWEETGLRVALVGEPAVVVDHVVRHVEFVVRARPLDEADVDLVRPTSPEIVEARWFDPEDMPPLHEHAARAFASLVRAERWREH